MAKLIFEEVGKAPLEIEAREGESVLHTLLDQGIDVEHACGGYCACSTCHVIVTEGMDNLSEQEDDEFDQLDRAKNVTLTSRLSCQCIIKGGTIKVKLP